MWSLLSVSWCSKRSPAPAFLFLWTQSLFWTNRWRSSWSFIYRPRQIERKKNQKTGDESCIGKLIFDGGSKRRRLWGFGALSWLHWSLEALAKFVFPNLGCAYVRISVSLHVQSHMRIVLDCKSAELPLPPSTEVERAVLLFNVLGHSSKVLGQVDEALDIIQQWGSQLGNDKGVSCNIVI